MTEWKDGSHQTDAVGAGLQRSIRAWRVAADEGRSTVVASGRAAYDRGRTLPRLIAFDVRDLSKPGPELDEAIRSKLERALRAERRRGVSGHWTYDLNRHLALAQALAAEQAPRNG